MRRSGRQSSVLSKSNSSLIGIPENTPLEINSQLASFE